MCVFFNMLDLSTTSFSELVDISNMEDTEFLVEDLDSGGEHLPKTRNPDGGYPTGKIFFRSYPPDIFLKYINVCTWIETFFLHYRY